MENAMIKRVLARFIPISIRKQVYNFQNLAVMYGQYKTIKNWDCRDKNNNYIPWYTYPAIEYFNNIDFSDKVIFEFVSGNSSIYWSKKAKKVISIEHNKKWYAKVKSISMSNQEILYREDSIEYESSLSEQDSKFDVIIIDGIRRIECSKMIKNFLHMESSEGCMVILDNADWYKETSKYLKETLDFIEIDFHGFGPINDYTWTTSIFLSRNFTFKAIKNIQPHFSISAVEHNGEAIC